MCKHWFGHCALLATKKPLVLAIEESLVVARSAHSRLGELDLELQALLAVITLGLLACMRGGNTAELG